MGGCPLISVVPKGNAHERTILEGQIPDKLCGAQIVLPFLNRHQLVDKERCRVNLYSVVRAQYHRP